MLFPYITPVVISEGHDSTHKSLKYNMVYVSSIVVLSSIPNSSTTLINVKMPLKFISVYGILHKYRDYYY